ERIEQDRPGIRDDRIAMLQEDGKRLEVGEARLLYGDAVLRHCGCEPLTPFSVTRMRAKEEREPVARTALPPPGEQPLHETTLERRIRGRIAHHQHDASRGIETELPQLRVVLGAGTA